MDWEAGHSGVQWGREYNEANVSFEMTCNDKAGCVERAKNRIGITEGV